ncbi:MAG: hypothetical protein IT167_22225 [Bryobacterales bacterium]|nr:hypothetical protein [Bryobacterales bacterium]
MWTRCLLFLLMTLPPLRAQESLSGAWIFHMQSPSGEFISRLTLKVDGDKVTGDFDFGEGRKLQIENGTWNGSELRMTVRRDRPQGGIIVYQMTASLRGKQLRGSVETELDGEKRAGEWLAERK